MGNPGHPLGDRAERRPPDNPFGYPVFVKPARLGSSVGISKVGEGELQEAVDLARRHDEKVLIEERAGVEVEVGVLGNKEPIASLPGEIVARFSGSTGTTTRPSTTRAGWTPVIPPRIPEDKSERVQQLAVEAFVATDCEGMARADCFVWDDGEVLVNELNTIPGFTATSVYARSSRSRGFPYRLSLDRLVEPPWNATNGAASSSSDLAGRDFVHVFGARVELGDPDEEVARLGVLEQVPVAVLDRP